MNPSTKSEMDGKNREGLIEDNGEEQLSSQDISEQELDECIRQYLNSLQHTTNDEVGDTLLKDNEWSNWIFYRPDIEFLNCTKISDNNPNFDGTWKVSRRNERDELLTKYMILTIIPKWTTDLEGEWDVETQSSLNGINIRFKRVIPSSNTENNETFIEIMNDQAPLIYFKMLNPNAPPPVQQPDDPTAHAVRSSYIFTALPGIVHPVRGGFALSLNCNTHIAPIVISDNPGIFITKPVITPSDTNDVLIHVVNTGPEPITVHPHDKFIKIVFFFAVSPAYDIYGYRAEPENPRRNPSRPTVLFNMKKSKAAIPTQNASEIRCHRVRSYYEFIIHPGFSYTIKLGFALSLNSPHDAHILPLIVSANPNLLIVQHLIDSDEDSEVEVSVVNAGNRPITVKQREVFCKIIFLSAETPFLVVQEALGTRAVNRRDLLLLPYQPDVMCFRPLHHQVELPVTRTKNFFDLNTIQSYTLAPGQFIKIPLGFSYLSSTPTVTPFIISNYSTIWVNNILEKSPENEALLLIRNIAANRITIPQHRNIAKLTYPRRILTDCIIEKVNQSLRGYYSIRGYANYNQISRNNIINAPIQSDVTSDGQWTSSDEETASDEDIIINTV